jgi:TetR/AcrR family transcriptional repressor of nem operon
LREKAKQGLESTLNSIKDIIHQGIRSGEFRSSINVDALAAFTFSLLEGGIMISKLEGNNQTMLLNIDTFSNHLKQCCLTQKI